MRIILVDTSCLISLGRIQSLELLKSVFGTVTVTLEVASEYNAKSQDSIPPWIILAAAKDRVFQSEIQQSLDPGEASIIALARELEKPLLILDDLAARNLATALDFDVTGTIGVLIEAKTLGFIPSLRTILSELGQVGFHFSSKLHAKALALAGEEVGP